MKQAIERNIAVAEWDAWAKIYSKEVDSLLGINDDYLLERFFFKGKNVLDIGCGTGRFLARITGKVKHITALDFSEEMLKQAGRRLQNFSNVHFENQNIDNTPLVLDKDFDIIMMISVGHHLHNLEQVCKNLKSILKIGGQIVVLEYLRTENIFRQLKFQLAFLRKYGVKKYKETFLDNLFLATNLRKHLAEEKNISYSWFKQEYWRYLPGAQVDIINGIFGLLIWNKKEEMSYFSS